MSCDSCDFVTINGVGCHEHGCPRAHTHGSIMLRGNRYKVMRWSERDRLHIAIVDAATEQRTFAEWWDEDAVAMFDDGFFDPRDLELSVIRYARDMGMLS